jgi:hypothetical protein
VTAHDYGVLPPALGESDVVVSSQDLKVHTVQMNRVILVARDFPKLRRAFRDQSIDSAEVKRLSDDSTVRPHNRYYI